MGLTLCAGRCYPLPRTHPAVVGDLAGAPVKQQLLISLTLILTAIGCRTAPQEAITMSLVADQGFVKDWESPLGLRNDPVKALHVREDRLIVYSQSNRGYWLSTEGGTILAGTQVAAAGYTLHPPILLNDHIVIPTTASIESFDKIGRRVDSFATAGNIQSSAAGTGDSIFLGVSGRLARFDVGEKLIPVWEMYTTAGVGSAPAIVGDAIFAAGNDGHVWALTANKAALWLIPDRSFQADGAITADLAADDFGVYVASQDKTLYCLDRATGRIKWSYHSGHPLVDGPTVMENLVLQPVPGVGLVAIDKAEGKMVRDVMWVAPQVRQVLAADEKYVYVLNNSKQIVALNRQTGAAEFHNTRRDLTVFATNLKTPVIYAATRSGSVIAIRPVLKPGTVGEVVIDAWPTGERIASAVPIH